MKSLLVLVFLAIASADTVFKHRGNLRAQVTPNTPMTIDNSATVTDARSEVSATCNRGTVTVSYANADFPTASASIRLGPESGDAACRTAGLVATSANPAVTTTTDETCGRGGDPTAFVWDVTVVEQYPRANPDFSDEFTTTFQVRCERSADQPDTPQVFDPAAPQNEGPAVYQGGIPFDLEIDTTASTPRQWVLRLRPEDIADLSGLSYNIDALTASSTGAAGLKSANLIAAGCPIDNSITIAQANTASSQVTTITVKAFQFSGNPGVPVSFEATVTLCTTPEADGGCAAPVCTAAPRNLNNLRRIVAKRSVAVSPNTAHVRVSF